MSKNYEKMASEIKSQLKEILMAMEGSEGVSKSEKERFYKIYSEYKNFIDNEFISDPGKEDKKAAEIIGYMNHQKTTN